MSNTSACNKKYNSNGNRYLSNGDGSWAETSVYQQNSPQNRKSKPQNMRNGNRYYSKNKTQTNIEQREVSEDIAVVPNETYQNLGYNQSIDQSLNESNSPRENISLKINTNDSINNTPNFSPFTTDSNASESVDCEEQARIEVPQYESKTFVPNTAINELPQTDISNGCHNNMAYEYDYQQTCVQQQSQYYIYQPYQDFVQVPNIAGSPLNSSLVGTPQQQQYYQAYQPMPSYIYDPQAGSYTSTYSPVQQNNQQTFQQIPDNQVNTNLSSPQQQQPASFLASYQTPPQPAHQLYIQTSNITPPTSLSPNDTPSTNSSTTASNDRTSNCNSPHPNQNSIVPNHLTQTPVHNPYVIYNPDMNNGVPSNNQYTMPPHNTNLYTPLTPQNYQCNSPVPTQQFMMYNPPPMTQGSPFQTGPNSPMMQTPYNANQNPNNFNTPKFNKSNNRANRYNGNNQNKRNFNNKNFGNNSNFSDQIQTPQSTYSLDENLYMNNQINNSTNGALSNAYENLEFPDSNQQIPMPMYPTSSYCDPNMGMPNAETILNAAYNGNYENIESYGDEYDGYGDDNGNGNDDNDENLACQVCRGRRMCFCYFLKVRYYKFPSFFDLVDHQYKKWRKSMANNNHLIQQQQIMNNSACGQTMNTSILNQNSPNMNNGMTSLPKKA